MSHEKEREEYLEAVRAAGRRGKLAEEAEMAALKAKREASKRESFGGPS